MERVFDWMLLNLLWLITSLPLITIGASTAALTEVTRQMAHGEDPAVFKGYFKAWAKHWKKASALWGILVVAAGWLLLSLRVCFAAGSVWFLPVAVVEGALLFVTVLTAPYVWAFAIRPEPGIGETVRQSVTAALKHLPWSVVLALLGCGPWAVTLLVPQALPYLLLFWLFFGVGCIAFVQRKIFDHLEKPAVTGLLDS